MAYFHQRIRTRIRIPNPFSTGTGSDSDPCMDNRVPTQTGKPGKMGRHFPVKEKSGNFEQTGKVREKSGKITQNTGKTSENFRKCYVIF